MAPEMAYDMTSVSAQVRRDFAETSSDWFWELGPDLRFTYVSDRVTAVTGIPVAQIVGRPMDEFLDQVDDAYAVKLHREDLHHHRPFRNVILHYRPQNGWQGYVRNSGVPVFAPDGAFLGYRGTCADITEEVEGRRALEGSDRLLRDAVKSLMEGFALYDADERLVLCNSQYREIFSLNKDLLVPGASFEGLTRAALARGQFRTADPEVWIAQRLAQFRNPSGPFEILLDDGRYIRCTDYRTVSGGTICLRADITDLKRVEQRLRDAIESMADGFALFDEEYRLVLCNEQYRELYPFLAKTEDLTGVPFRELAQRMADADVVVLAEGETPAAWVARRVQHFLAPHEPTFLLRFKTGRQFELRTRLTAQGGRVSVSTDITERRQIEEALRESRDGLQRAQQLGRIGSITIDVATGKTMWSEEQYRLLGLDPAAGGGNLPLLLTRLHPDDRHLLVEERARNMRGEEPHSFEFRIVLPSGEIRWARREGEIVRDIAGNPVQVVATMQDITESRWAAEELIAIQNQLRESEVRYRAYFDTSMDGQLLTRPDGSILEANAAACEMLGRSEEEITRLGRDGIADMTDTRLHAATAERARRGEVRAEFNMVRADGSKFPVEVASRIFSDATGRPMTAMSLRDLTERHRLEERLVHTQKMEALGILAGGIAHDLNNALVPVIALTKLIAQSLPPDGRERERLELVMSGANRAKELVERIVTFARSEPKPLQPIDLTQIVAEGLKVVRAGILPGIAVRIDLGTERLPILGNATQILQVIMNLCANAAQAVDGRTGKITVILRSERDKSEPAAGGQAVLSVIDNGAGMDEATQQRCFDPFFTTKKVGEGTGLGLSIVHGIVTAHGGTIAVDSHLGEGTRFDLRFPLLTNATEAAADTARQASP